MDELGQRIQYIFEGNVDSLRSATNRAMDLLDGYQKKVDSVTSGVTRVLRNTVGALTGLQLGDWIAKAAKESINFVENLNLFTVAMGDSIKVGLKFVDTMAEIYGMDPSNLYRYAGYFYQLTDAIGMADDASAIISLSLTKLSNDVASLFNVPINQVVDNLASGMQGMSRAVRKYGMDIRATTLQETAAAYGLTQNVQSMSEANRMALRYLTMLDQVKNATQQTTTTTAGATMVMGDFARNIETPANQLRIFREQITQLARAIGNFLIPILRKVLPIVNGIIMALRMMLQTIATLIGIDLNFGGATVGGIQDTAGAIGDVGDAASGATKKLKELKKTLAPFDEINLLQDNTDTGSYGGGGGGGGGGIDSGAVDPALLEAIKSTSLGLEDIKMKANEVRDSILDFFGFKYVDVFNEQSGEYEKKLQWFADQFEKNLINKFPQWEQTITALFEHWGEIISGFKHLFESLGDVVDQVKKKLKNFAESMHLDETFAKGISNLGDNLDRLADWISKHSSGLANLIFLITGVVTAFSAISSVVSILAPLGKVAVIVARVVVLFNDFFAVIAIIIGAFALLKTHSDTFTSSLSNMGSSLAATGQSIMTMFRELWEETLQPLFQSIWEAIDTLMDLIGQLWDSAIGPILEAILASLPDLVSNVISPLLKGVIGIIAALIETIMGLWTNVIAPLVAWLINTFGPAIRNVFVTVWNVVSSVVQGIAGIIGGLLQVLRGIIDFIGGVFTLDWARAWQGIKEIFSGIINAELSALELGINIVIGLVNSLISLMWTMVQTFVNGILSTVNTVAGILGYSVNLQWGSPPPAIGYLHAPKVALAQGGVVTGPTTALIGEGRYDEAVIPLGNSPQMNEFADSIASKLNGTEQVQLLREQNSLLRQILDKTGVELDGRELSRVVTRYQTQEARAMGV